MEPWSSHFCARQQLDFCSVTGHAFWPDLPTDRARYGDIIDYHLTGFATLASNWDELIRVQREATQAGDFVAFPSYEWHSLKYGDHNIYAAGPDLELQDAPTLPALRDVVRRSQAIAIPHHIGYAQGYRGINWDAYNEDVSPFVEIYSLHGCSLSDDAPYPMLHDMGPRDSGSTAEAGWQRGYRFGIVGGTDHHAAYPGSHGDGRMGVFATALTRESLWEAFRARRVYAATGDPMDARMFLNDAWIGEVVHAPQERVIRVQVQGTDAIDRVELVKNQRVIQRWFAVPGEIDRRRHRYRLRITWGWGRNNVPVKWQGSLDLSEGVIEQVDTLFSGQAIVSPQDSPQAKSIVDEQVNLPHDLSEVSARGCRWRSTTMGNKTMRHETTQGLSLLLEAPLSAVLTVEANGVICQHSLAELLRAGRSHFLRGWLSEAIRIGPLVPAEDWTVTAEFRDTPEQPVDIYRLQVAQKNGQWAWLTPIWAES